MSAEPFADFDEAEFRALQQRLVPLWPGMTVRSVDRMDRVLLVIPSITADVPSLRDVLHAYEERYLFMVLALVRSPQTRVVYVTSLPMQRRLVDYYLDLVGADRVGMDARLTVISVGDPTATPLTYKILRRPRLIERIRRETDGHEHRLILPFMTTRAEAELSVRLGVPLYGTHPDLVHLGTKTGSRSVFAAAAVPHAPGVDGVRTAEDVCRAVALLLDSAPGARRFVVKLDAGVGGLGNADLRLADDAAPRPAELDSLLRPEDDLVSPVDFLAALAAEGGVVELWLDGDEVASPSVQLRTSPLGEVEVLTTHDQVLGGPTGQSFLGCEFPARDEFIGHLTRCGRAIGRELAAQGVVGRFGVDFVMVRRGDRWHPYAIEINLRNGGTTHPALTLMSLTDGVYDEATGMFDTATGRKFYVASDHVERPEYRQLTPDDVLDLVLASGLSWDAERQTGVALHMVSAVAAAGRIGATAIGNSHEQARDLYARLTALLDRAVNAP